MTTITKVVDDIETVIPECPPAPSRVVSGGDGCSSIDPLAYSAACDAFFDYIDDELQPTLSALKIDANTTIADINEVTREINTVASEINTAVADIEADRVAIDGYKNETIAARNDTLNTAGYVAGLVNINFVTFLNTGNGHLSVVVNDLNVSTPSVNSNGHFLINIA